MKIISISGLDGSGKSTQVKLLKKHFESRGKKVYYFHAVQFSVANILTKRQEINSEGKPKDVTEASWLGIQLRKIALFCDVIRFKFLVLCIDRKYDYMLTDRYFYDMIVNIAFLSKKHYHPFYCSWITRPNKRFFLDVNPAYILMRDNPPLQGHDYLRDKNVIFRVCVEHCHLTVIDGSRNKQTIFDDLLTQIEE
jgi:thymidylate kinase